MSRFPEIGHLPEEKFPGPSQKAHFIPEAKLIPLCPLYPFAPNQSTWFSYLNAVFQIQRASNVHELALTYADATVHSWIGGHAHTGHRRNFALMNAGISSRHDFTRTISREDIFPEN